MLDASKLEKGQNIYTSEAIWQKLVLQLKPWYQDLKNTNPFGHPRDNKMMLAVGKARPLQRISALGLAVCRGAASQLGGASLGHVVGGGRVQRFFM